MIAQSQKHKYLDPVCGMGVDPDSAAGEACHNGIKIYFCTPGCKKAFEANPDKYTRQQRKGFWKRYLDRLNKATGGQPPACH